VYPPDPLSTRTPPVRLASLSSLQGAAGKQIPSSLGWLDFAAQERTRWPCPVYSATTISRKRWVAVRI